MTSTPTVNSDQKNGFNSITYVPAKSGVYTIVGNSRYFPPIFQLTNSIYRISGDIAFTPEPNKIYVVKGEMNEQHSVIWIEENDTGIIVGNKIEVIGSTAVGFLEK